jgi:hypothetical protein
MDGIEKIKSFAKLENGWDSYDARPPNELCIKTTIDLFEKIAVKPPKIVPSVVGGIAFVYKETYIEIDNEGEIYYFTYLNAEGVVMPSGGRVNKVSDIDELKVLLT